MSIFRRLVSLPVFLFFLVGCVTPNSTSDLASITPQLSQSSSPVGDLGIPSLITISPASTSQPSAPPDITQTAFVQGIISTQFAEETLASLFPRACELLYAPREFSPNGLWMVEFCPTSGDDFLLTFSNSEQQILWQLYYKDYVPQTNDFPDGKMSVVHWSNDGRYAYFYSNPGGDGGECYIGQTDSGVGLFRIDLQTGFTTAILPKNEDRTWYTFSFSPTGRRLVYGIYSLNLTILDIPTGELTSVITRSDFSQSGGYLWSPDGLQFVYSTVTTLDDWETRTYSVILVDALSGYEQIVIDSSKNCFAPLSWTENNILTLEKNYFEAIVEFDLNANKIISEATSTPSP